MGPGLDFDTAGKQSLTIPKLKDDGSNWVDYEPKMRNALGAKGLLRHVDGLAISPKQFAKDVAGLYVKADGTTKCTEDEIEKREEKIEDFTSKEYLARHMIVNSVSMRLTHEIRSLASTDMWKTVTKDATSKSQLFKIDAKRRLGDLKCVEGEDVREHLDRLIEVKDELLAMGSVMKDDEFVETILASLPQSFRSLISSIVHSASISGVSVTPTNLVRILREEGQQKAIEARGTASSEMAMSAEKGKERQKKGKSQKKCHNCGKPGHFKADCWAPGGGKEGQGPKQKGKDKSVSVAKKEAEETMYAFACTSDYAHVASRATKNSVQAMMDSGASDHFSPERDKFTNYRSTVPAPIYAADGHSFNAIGEGDLNCWLTFGDQKTRVTFKKAVHAPNMANTLISIGRLDEANYRVEFGNGECKIYAPYGMAIGIAAKLDRLYRPILHFEEPKTAAAAAKKISMRDAHRLLGHISYQAVRHAIKTGAVVGIDVDLSSPEDFCEACAQAKPHRKPFPTEAENRAKEFGERLIGDTWGPAQVRSIGGNYYSMDLVDDNTRWTHVEFMPAKKGLIDRYKRYEGQLETQHGVKVKFFRVDRGTEFKNKEFNNHLATKGTKWEFTVHDTHEQVGVVERWNRTKIELARAMLVGSGLPRDLWAEAVNHAGWLKNRMPTRALNGGTPFQGRYGKPADLRGLVPFGTECWVKVVGAKKLDRRARKAHFVGYDDESTGFRVYFPDKRSIGIEREVVFNVKDDESFVTSMPEGEKRRADAPEPVIASKPVILPNDDAADMTPNPLEPIRIDNEVASEPEPAPAYQRRGRDEPDPSLIVEGKRERPKKGYWKGLNQAAAGIAMLSENPLTFDDGHYANAAVVGNDPQSLREALERDEAPQWQAAWDTEIKQLMDRQTWELVPRQQGMHVIPNRPVFHAKPGPDGKIAKYKVRVTAGGHRQIEGIDYGETFASVAKVASIRLVLAYAAAMDWEVHHIDVVGAFLNAKLEEEIFMEAPDGVLKPGDEGKVCRLLRGLYGLKQAGRAWYKDLRRTFVDMGFVRSRVDHSVFIRKQGAEILVVPVSTDDMAVAGAPLSAVQTFKVQMAARYEITDLGEVSWLLGFEVVRNRLARTITISQRAYIEAMALHFAIVDSKPVYTPMETGADFSKPEHSKKPADAPYREACGHLLWPAMIGRPDVLFAVVHLAQFVENPSESQWKAVKRVMKYLYTTRDYGLTLGGISADLVGYTDSDWASQLHRHSISGYAFFLGEGCVTWSSKKQPIIALSTAEAEYVAGTHSTKEAIWIRAFLCEFEPDYANPTPLNCDNQSAIALAKDARYHARTKHIDIRYHFIREQVEGGTITIQYVPSQENVADIFTKALPRPQFEILLKRLGVGNRPS
jgi:hypothetical protein